MLRSHDMSILFQDNNRYNKLWSIILTVNEAEEYKQKEPGSTSFDSCNGEKKRLCWRNFAHRHKQPGGYRVY